MTLQLGPDDERGFARARRSLLKRFEEWLGDERSVGPREAEDLADDVGVALDWRWHHGDGDLSEWTIGDVSEFLLAWCPRKLSVSAAEC